MLHANQISERGMRLTWNDTMLSRRLVVRDLMHETRGPVIQYLLAGGNIEIFSKALVAQSGTKKTFRGLWVTYENFS